MGNSVELGLDGAVGLAVNPPTAHVRGSISLTMGSSSATFASASTGTLTPLKPKGDGFGFTMMRGHSAAKLSNELLSIFGCQWKGEITLITGGEASEYYMK